jgi:hypothetical protein
MLLEWFHVKSNQQRKLRHADQEVCVVHTEIRLDATNALEGKAANTEHLDILIKHLIFPL